MRPIRLGLSHVPSLEYMQCRQTFTEGKFPTEIDPEDLLQGKKREREKILKLLRGAFVQNLYHYAVRMMDFSLDAFIPPIAVLATWIDQMRNIRYRALDSLTVKTDHTGNVKSLDSQILILKLSFLEDRCWTFRSFSLY